MGFELERVVARWGEGWPNFGKSGEGREVAKFFRICTWKKNDFSIPGRGGNPPYTHDWDWQSPLCCGKYGHTNARGNGDAAFTLIIKLI